MSRGTAVTGVGEHPVQKLDKDKREVFWYFHPEYAMENDNWVQCNHCFSANCFLRSMVLRRLSFL